MIMISMDAILIIEGVSQLGKNRVVEHGNSWKVIGVSQSVKALNNNMAVLLQSTKTGYVKWMARESGLDTDFQIFVG